MKKKKTFSPTRTQYPGVYYILGTDPGGIVERIFYISYRVDGRQHFEKAGREFRDGMTALDARRIRSDKIRGRALPNREAREAERTEKAALDARWTIGRLAEEYFTHRERKKTVRTDRNLYNRFLDEDFKERTPEEIDPPSLDRFRMKLSQRKSSRDGSRSLSPASVRNALALLRQIVNHGVERRLTNGFPGKVPVPRVAATSRNDDLTPAHLSALLAALDADVDQDAADVVRLALYTGARREELLGMRWEDVDLASGLWTLRNRKAGGVAGIPLSSHALEILLKREETRSEGSEFVFPGSGKRGYLRDPRSAFKRITSSAKLPENFRLLHGNRRRFEAMLVAEGVDLLTVARLLGYADAQMVMRRYAHVRPGELAAAAELPGDLIAEAVALVRRDQGEA